MFPVVSPPIFQIIIRKYLKNGAASGTEWSEPTREKFGKSLCLSGIFQVPLHIVYFVDFGRFEKTALPHNTKLCVVALCCWGKAVFLFCQKAHSFSIFRRKSAFLFDFWKNRKFSVPARIQPRKGALLCANKFKKSVAPKSNWKNVRVSAVCMTKYSLPPRDQR